MKPIMKECRRAMRELNRTMLWTGIVLLLVGIFAPMVLTVENFLIYDSIKMALDGWEKIYILVAALQLVILNTLRAVPHYLGAFFLAEAINGTTEKRWTPLSIIAIFITIPGVYFLIEVLYGIRYDLGIPAVSMSVIMLAFSNIRFDFVNTTKKILVMVMMITSIQFLDVMPALNGLPIGRGESSLDIKMASLLLGADEFLQAMAMIFSVLFFAMSLLLVVLVHDENNIILINKEKERSERALMENQLRVLENRTYMELNHLVHDLKSPLTTMQTLIGVVKMSCEQRQDHDNVFHLEKVEAGIERMSGMISEILYEDHFTEITTRKLINGVLTQVSTSEYTELLQVENAIPEAHINVNVIRITRAIINLLENSFYAIDRKSGTIKLTITPDVMDGEAAACIMVQDNGTGIDRETLNRVLAYGFSTRNSSGLGLSFVEKVISQSGGQIKIDSIPDVGTTVSIYLPVCEAEPCTSTLPNSLMI